MKAVLVIPFYKNEEYISQFVSFFEGNPSQKSVFNDVIIINDCPLSEKSEWLESQCVNAKFVYLANEQNIGYLLTANLAFKIAKERRSHLVLLNSDTIPYGECFSELLSCFSLDPMLGCVAPRSNNATICNLLESVSYIESSQDVDALAQVFEDTLPLVPKLSYAPVVNGFCFCVRDTVVSNFPGFSHDFLPGYEEENEYCLRIAEHGFRMGICNHSFIAHLEGRSFGLKPGRDALREKNSIKINQLYPYYSESLTAYSREVSVEAYRRIVEAVETHKNTILVDARNLAPYHNGTNKVVVEILKALSGLGYAVHVLASEASLEFHQCSSLKGVERIESAKGVYYIGLKIAQPFDNSSLFTVPCHSVFAVNLFFDVIADDCTNLRQEMPSLHDYWELMGELYSDIFFISEHSRRQFELKFPCGRSRFHDALLPTAIYGHEPAIADGKSFLFGPGKFALVVGNKFKHKGVSLAINELAAVAGLRYKVLAESFECQRDDVDFLPPGNISESDMDLIYRQCEFVVFPSFSEGFGFPLLEAISYGKPVFCRPLPPFFEIVETLVPEKRDLVRFVTSFGSLDEAIVSVPLTQKVAVQGYTQYVSELLRGVVSVGAQEFYPNFRSRIQTIQRVLSSPPAKDRFVHIIYRALKKRKLTAPIAKAGRAFFKATRLS